MFTPKPTSKFIFFALILLLSLTFLINSSSSNPTTTTTPAAADDDEDTDGIEELLAVDEQEEALEEEEQQQQQADGTHHHSHAKSSEAELLTKAQRIVLELNNDNFQRAVDGNEYVLVLGYAPWCVRSAELMPRFAEAATNLKELGSSLLLAKLDAERFPKVASTLGIKGYPTLLLFVNATSQPYTGGFSWEEIMIWARKKTGVPVIRISSVDEANQFLEKHSIFSIGLFEKFEGPHYEEFVKAATSDNEIQFVETSSSEIANILFPDVKPTNLFLGLVKSEPERYTVFEDTFTEDNILQFVDSNKFPLVTILTELNSAKVYSNTGKLQVYVFADAEDFKKLLEPFQDASRKFKSKLMFIFVNINEENLAKPFLTLFGLEDSEDTIVAAFDYKIGSKYLLESDPIRTKIEEFCEGLVQGTILPFYKSQPIPDNKDADILAIVGKTFDNLVLSSPKNILLEVYTPWCFNCETTSKNVEKLAKHFKGLESLTFARIDASANEHPKLQVNEFPTLLFYPMNDKSTPIKLPTKASLKDLAILINKNVKAQHQRTKDEL